MCIDSLKWFAVGWLGWNISFYLTHRQTAKNMSNSELEKKLRSYIFADKLVLTGQYLAYRFELTNRLPKHELPEYLARSL